MTTDANANGVGNGDKLLGDRNGEGTSSIVFRNSHLDKKANVKYSRYTSRPSFSTAVSLIKRYKYRFILFFWLNFLSSNGQRSRNSSSYQVAEKNCRVGRAFMFKLRQVPRFDRIPATENKVVRFGLWGHCVKLFGSTLLRARSCKLIQSPSLDLTSSFSSSFPFLDRAWCG